MPFLNQSLTALFRVNFRKSSSDCFWSPHNNPLPISRDDDTAASQTCNKPTVPVPASPSSRYLHHQRADTCITCKPALVFSMAADQIIQQYPVYEWQYCLDCHQRSETISTHPWLTMDWINRDVNHPASTTYALEFLLSDLGIFSVWSRRFLIYF